MDSIDYDSLIQEALRSVVRNTLGTVIASGLPATHHFYITFRTDRDDVIMPSYLREQHPDEVTIVLQHQFWDLEVDAHKFSVTLSFNGMQERLSVPFTALVSFMDPSVKFGLQFLPENPPTSTLESPDAANSKSKKKSGKGKKGSKDNIVTLDTFRKKKT